MIIEELNTNEIPEEYTISIYLDTPLEESSNYIIRKKYLRVPDELRNSKLKRTSNKEYKKLVTQFRKSLYDKTSPRLQKLLNISIKKLNFNFINTITPYPSTSEFIDENGYMCYAFYFEITIKPELFKGKVSPEFLNKINSFKIRFAEHISEQELQSIQNKNTIILNMIYALDTQSHTIQKQIDNIIKSRLLLYNYINDTKVPITNFNDIDDTIIVDCLKYKQQGNF